MRQAFSLEELAISARVALLFAPKYLTKIKVPLFDLDYILVLIN